MFWRRSVLFYPLFVFIGTIVAAVTAIFLYLQWYLSFKGRLALMVNKFHLDRSVMNDTHGVVVMITMTLLLLGIMASMSIIFFFYEKSNSLMRLQKSFIDNFTHELKTPIASLKLYLDTFLRHDMNRMQQKQFLQYMEKDVQRLSGNVQMILQVAALESVKKNYALTLTDLRLFVRQFLANNAHLYQGSNIKLDWNEELKESYSVPINAGLFEMLLMNLINNAIRYSPPQSELRIQVGKDTKEGVFLAVHDQGIGIPKQFEKKVFEKFFRVENDQRYTKGTGLGLYLCAQIAKVHGAKIKAKGLGENRGSTISIFFQDKNWG